MARKQIPKGIRFEVLKRDKFTCQYCGREAPDVILEVDHIVPVSKGGDNSVMNLVTACRDCNRGKTNKELSDDSTVKKSKRQADELQARREQIEMMVEWKNSLAEEIEMEIDSIETLLKTATGYELTTNGRNNIRRQIKRFGFSEVYTSTEIALNYYYRHEDDFEKMFWKIGGICYNRKKERDSDAE